MKHTKGPWIISGKAVTTSEHRPEIVCEAFNEANARLIAAAPELLAELKQALSLIQSIERETGYVTLVTQNQWIKLIAKAEGNES